MVEVVADLPPARALSRSGPEVAVRLRPRWVAEVEGYTWPVAILRLLSG
jgi:hypothetical protein